MAPVIIGVAGGSGSGKTTVSNHIRKTVGDERLAYLQHDSYYHDASHLPPAERAQQNHAPPTASTRRCSSSTSRSFGAAKPCRCLSITLPTYTRIPQPIPLHPARVILVEGILIFSDKTLRGQIDIRIFVDTDADLCFIRRLQRDVSERGRTQESVSHQYLTTVRPMHLEFVEPSKRYADIIVPNSGHNTVALDMIVSRIQDLLHQSN